MNTRKLDRNHLNAQKGLDGLLNEVKELIADRREQFGEDLDQAKIWVDIAAALMPPQVEVPDDEPEEVKKIIGKIQEAKTIALTGLLAVAVMRAAQPDTFAELEGLDFEPSLDLDEYYKDEDEK